MKIIQTFWSGRKGIESPLKISAGWVSPEYHWMSWALSCLLLRRLYDRVELYTDAMGKSVLVDILGLPYTKVHVVFDDSFVIHPELFSLAKIQTYSLQEEPFIHIDGDVFLWKRFPDNVLNAQLVASNLEKNLFFNKDILKEVEGQFYFIPDHLIDVHDHENIYACNAGIFGGSNIDFIQSYCKEAFGFIAVNGNKLDRVKTKSLNFLIEQISLYYLSEKKYLSITYYVKDAVDHPLYQDFLRFIDIPNVEMVHPVGGCKKTPYVLHHLANRLRLEFPEYYYKILKNLKDDGINLDLRIYNYVTSDMTLERQRSKLPFVAIDNKINTLEAVSFQNIFGRTIKAVECLLSICVLSHDELFTLLHKKTTPIQLTELYKIENERHKKFKHLIRKLSEENLYETDFNRYGKSVNFHFKKGWLDKKISFPGELSLMELKWNWKLFSEEPCKDVLEKIMNTEESTYYLTLTYNILNIDINETYHDDIDKLILTCAKKKSLIKDIALEASAYFEDEVTVDNIEYQRLLFDTIKRLVHSNIFLIL